MKTPRTRISSLVADRTLKGGSSKQLSRELAAYLLQEGRTGDLDSILRDVQVDWAEAGYVQVIASSSHPLTPAVKASIEQRVQKLYPDAKRVSVIEEHDPRIIGGVRLNMANRQLDLSVEAKLNKFKQLTLSGKE